MNKNFSIKEHEAFRNCRGKIIAELIGGSTLYGLNTPESDIDYRGIFIATHPTYVSGLDTVESIVQTGEIDSSYYELSRFLKLLRKSNTQVLEILFAPDSAFTVSTPFFQELRDNRFELIDTKVFKSSLKGYVFSEIRLATGERTGQLGSKRKQALEKYGFSPKNFTQILRLCQVGIEFFKHGNYVVDLSLDDPTFHSFLMEIKTQPGNFTCDQLKKLVDDKYNELETIMDESEIHYKFNINLAADLILSARKTEFK